MSPTANSVGFVPVQFSLGNCTVRKPDRSIPLQLSPPTFAVALSQQF
jgi:hypothetical protein